MNVVWQKKAWVDQESNLVWTDTFLKPYLEATHADEETLLFCDNLACQVMPEFRELLEEVRCIRFAGPKGATHLWQPVDQNIGAFYHRYMMDRYDDWMSSGAALKYAAGTAGQTLSVEVRRELLMQWCGQCYDELERRRKALEEQGKEEESIFYRAFLNTGLLVTADGSDDDQIRVLEKLRNGGAPEARIDSVEQARQRQGEDFVIYLSDDEEDESDFDDGAATDEELDDDEFVGLDDNDDDLVGLAEVEAENLIAAAVADAAAAADIVERLRTVQMRDDFLAEVDVGQEADSGREASKKFEAEFKKLRLEYLEKGLQFPRHGTVAYDNLVDSLRNAMLPPRRARSDRFRIE